MKSGSLFSGYGGLDQAVNAVLGTTTAWHCEIDPAATRILAHHHPHIPNHGDITQVNWDQVEPVDVLTGGFPCQDVSAAGRRAGLRPGTRSGLWTHMAYAISQLRPRLVVIENVRGLLSAAAHSNLEPCPWCVGDGTDEPPLRALGAVLGDLADLGFDARWHGVRASDAGAPHARYRVFIVATDTNREAGGLLGSRGVTPGAEEGTLRQAGRGAGRDRSSRSLANADGQGLAQRGGIGSDPRPQRQAALRGGAPADPVHNRREGRQERDIWPEGEQPTPLRGDADRRVLPAIEWGDYEPAIRRWEHILGRPAPDPTEPGARGNRRLSPRFVEWLMGLDDGWVTDVPGITRNDQLKALGNGVVPQQAELALANLIQAQEIAA